MRVHRESGFLERMHLQESDTPTTMPHMHANKAFPLFLNSQFFAMHKKVSTTMIQFGCCKADHHNRQI